MVALAGSDRALMVCKSPEDKAGLQQAHPYEKITRSISLSSNIQNEQCYQGSMLESCAWPRTSHDSWREFWWSQSELIRLHSRSHERCLWHGGWLVGKDGMGTWDDFGYEYIS